MPFDGAGFAANEYSEKIDAVIDLIGTPEKWVKGSFRTHDGRYCLRGAMRALDRNEKLKPIIIDAIKEVTGIIYVNIEGFNDNRSTDHTMILMVLARAREIIDEGRFRMDVADAIRSGLFKRCWNRMTAWFDRCAANDSVDQHHPCGPSRSSYRTAGVPIAGGAGIGRDDLDADALKEIAGTASAGYGKVGMGWRECSSGSLCRSGSPPKR